MIYKEMKPQVITIIMGGGRGTRLFPLTQQRCKPAVPLAGKYRLIDIPVSNCINSGYNKIYILTQFNTASLHRHIQGTYNFDPFGRGFVDILAAEQTEESEKWYQGTADAVRQNLHHFYGEDNDYFLILSGDQLYRMDFRKLIEFHQKSGSDVTISAKAIPIHKTSQLGVIKVNEEQTIEAFVEKPGNAADVAPLALSSNLRAEINDPSNTPYCLASMGIYVFNLKALKDALKLPGSDFGKEIIPALLGKKKMSAYMFDGYWEDIGTVRSFFETNLMLTDPLPQFNFFDAENPIYTYSPHLPAAKINSCWCERSILSDGCIITDAAVKHCVVGVRSVIREGSLLENVIMMGADHFEVASDGTQPMLGIGRNCRIMNAIIDKNARIGNNVVLSPEGKSNDFVQGDVYVRDGVLIVNKKGVIPDGTVI